MRSLFSLVQIFTFIDWVIAAFIAGTAARIQGKKPDGTSTGRRTALAVGISVMFIGFAVLRIAEFMLGNAYIEDVRKIVNEAPPGFKVGLVLLAFSKTCLFLFAWFAVTIEKRERQGLTSGNVIRHFLLKVFDRLR